MNDKIIYKIIQTPFTFDANEMSELRQIMDDAMKHMHQKLIQTGSLEAEIKTLVDCIKKLNGILNFQPQYVVQHGRHLHRLQNAFKKANFVTVDEWIKAGDKAYNEFTQTAKAGEFGMWSNWWIGQVNKQHWNYEHYELHLEDDEKKQQQKKKPTTEWHIMSIMFWWAKSHDNKTVVSVPSFYCPNDDILAQFNDRM